MKQERLAAMLRSPACITCNSRAGGASLPSMQISLTLVHPALLDGSPLEGDTALLNLTLDSKQQLVQNDHINCFGHLVIKR